MRHAAYYSPSGTYSAGVLLSTVNDLGKFGASLYTNKLLTETSRQQMWTPHLSQAQNELAMHFSVGYSWFFVEPPGQRPFIGHNGGMLGFASAFIHFRAERVTAVALYNIDTVAQPHKLCQEIVEFYLA
jgi:CubicO group peptidase (beta-lactamase class C family)